MARTQLDWLLRLAVAGGLVGHGAYGAILAKPSWFDYFAVLGLSASTVEATGLLRIVGGAEIALGLIVVVCPVPALLMFLAGWKIGTELLRPAAGEPAWEFVERGSNMLAPLALLYVRGWPASRAGWLRTRSCTCDHRARPHRALAGSRSEPSVPEAPAMRRLAATLEGILDHLAQGQCRAAARVRQVTQCRSRRGQ